MFFTVSIIRRPPVSCHNQSRLRDQYRLLPRFLDRTGRVDMIALWALETLFGFVGFYAVSGGVPVAPLPMTGAIAGQGITVADQALLLSVLLGAPGIVLGLYKPDVVLETRRLLLTALVAAICSAPLLWLVSALGLIDTRALFGGTRAWLAALMLFWLALLVCTRLAYTVCIRSGLFVRDVVLLGDEPEVRNIAAVLAASHPRLFRVTQAGPASRQPLMRSLRRPWQVIVDADRAITLDALRTRSGRPARVTDLGTFWERQLGRVDLCSLTPSEAVEGIAKEEATARILHRGLDIVVASLLLVLTAPLMLLAALMVWLDSTGPLIYRQERIGLDGRRFVILKFRSMRVDAEADGKAMFAARNDRRVTRVGAFMRKVRLDELPQLFNILLGDMSVVGPRPERPDFVQLYDATIPFYSLRLRVKPGLTGWAQVNSAYTASETETRIKLAYDLYYLRNRSVLLDLSIMVATVRVILFGVGAR